MRSRLLFSAAALALALPSGAHAADVSLAVGSARSYWRAAGIPLTCTPAIVVAPIADPLVAAWGWPAPECRIQFDPDALSYPQRTFCKLAVHEYGHVLGLTHADVDRFPIMSGTQSTYEVRTKFCDGAAKIGRLKRSRGRAPRIRNAWRARGLNAALPSLRL